MIHYIFDLDDTLIIHQNGLLLDYNNIQINHNLKKLFDNCKGELLYLY